VTIITERQQRILKLLQEQEFLRIKDLIGLLQVSSMTVHRDINQLARSGMVVKVHGGAALAVKSEKYGGEQAECALCHKPEVTRTAFIIYNIGGEMVQACCPHCGLFLLSKLPTTVLALSTDFLYGKMVNAQYASYLIQSAVNYCCVPSLLSFANREDAEKFQKGFGGQVMNFEQTRHHLHKLMLLEESTIHLPGEA